MRSFRCLGALLLALVTLSACGPSYENGPPGPERREIVALEQAILSLGADVAEDEAAAAARVAFTYPLELADRYEITDPPIIHNMKVNAGRRPRGLCYQWADDLEARLGREGFASLELHRAIANHDRPLAIEHSTVVLSRRGAPMEEGIVLDPWRWGGKLYWSRVPDDPRYEWWPREEVFAWKRGRDGAMRGEIPAE